MDLVRIGDKVVSQTKVIEVVKEILHFRMLGMSQIEVGDRLNIERTFISRLEGIGEIRKGQSIAAVGFPIGNKAEVEEVLREYGVDYHILMSERERNEFVTERSGSQLINRIMELTNKFREFDTVIVMASDYRGKVIKGMLDNQVIGIDIGKSPLKADVTIDIKELTDILKILKG